MSNVLKNIPSVGELLESPQLKQVVDRVSHNVVVSSVRSFVDNLRHEVQSATSDRHVPSASELAEKIASWILDQQVSPLRPVINATGILLHGGLGRSPLAAEALQAVQQASQGYVSLEVDLASGRRVPRQGAVERLLRELTGAEAALVVNNKGAATLLTLAALAPGREVLVARGELVESGTDYRLPEVIQSSGAVLREVGTTNRTRQQDYRAALNEQTGAIMKVTPTHYEVVGFTESTPLSELVEIARHHKDKIPVIDDVGGAGLLDYREYGIAGVPRVADRIKAGADVVLMSGDKMLGGPQAGILVGKRKVLEIIAQHPLHRLLRVDKMTLAALTATLQLYQDPALAQQHLPLLMLLSTSLENLKNRADRLAPQIAATPGIETVDVLEGMNSLHGSPLPHQQQATWCLSVKPARGTALELADQLRSGTLPLIGRVDDARLVLDLRTVFPAQDRMVVEAFQRLDNARESEPPAPQGLEEASSP